MILNRIRLSIVVMHVRTAKNDAETFSLLIGRAGATLPVCPFIYSLSDLLSSVTSHIGI